MSDESNTTSEVTRQVEADSLPLPSQMSAQDTSNWDDRPLMTPSGRVVIEMNQHNDKEVIAE